MLLARLLPNSRQLVVKFLGSHSYTWIFECMWGGQGPQPVKCSRVNCTFFSILLVCKNSGKIYLHFFRWQSVGRAGRWWIWCLKERRYEECSWEMGGDNQNSIIARQVKGSSEVEDHSYLMVALICNFAYFSFWSSIAMVWV